MPIAAAIPLISGGLSLASSIFGAKSGNKTTTAPSFTKQQSAVQDTLGKSIQSDLANPANLDPQKALAIGQINENTDNLQKRLQTTESSRGFGRSGRLGLKSSQLEIGRTDQLGGLEDQFAQLQLDQNNKVRQQAQQYGFADPTTTKTETASPLGAGLGAGSSLLATLFGLNKFLGAGGSTQGAGGSGETSFEGNNPLSGIGSTIDDSGA